MALTGKAKEDFEIWYSRTESDMAHNLQKELFYSKAYIERYSYYLEWLDSVGIYIHIKRFCQGLEFKEWYYIISDTRGVYLNEHLSDCRIKDDCRQEATKQAILKANEIYNERK